MNATGRKELSVKVSVTRYATRRNLSRFKPIYLEYPNKTAIFLASGSVQQNYLFFTRFGPCGQPLLAEGQHGRRSEPFPPCPTPASPELVHGIHRRGFHSPAR